MKKHLFNSAVWPDFTIIPHPHHAILNLRALMTGESIRVNSYSVSPYKVNHTVPSVGYLVEDKKGKRFFYTGDTGPTYHTWKKIGNKQINCLIIDVSFPNSMEYLALKTGHMTPDLLKAELTRFQYEPEMICVTHMKPQYMKMIRNELRGLKIKNLLLLRDNDTIRV
jgi:cAMP phosphodiesterase